MSGLRSSKKPSARNKVGTDVSHRGGRRNLNSEVVTALGPRPGIVWIDRLVIIKEADADGGRVHTTALSADQVRALRLAGADSWQPQEWRAELPRFDSVGALPPGEGADELGEGSG